MILSQLLKSESWTQLLKQEFDKPYLHQLDCFLEKEYCTKDIFPKKENIFKALEKCDIESIKVVILGQDPYHGEGQAHGLSFSVPHWCKIPKSLVNIFKELNDDIGCEIPKNGNLESWASQGVLLLNATLTVEASKPNSHQNKGWEKLTDFIISEISKKQTSVVFILWGSFAHKKEILIDQNKHFILKSAHPSPLSVYRGFFGSKPFSKANVYLNEHHKKQIDWEIKF